MKIEEEFPYIDEDGRRFKWRTVGGFRIKIYQKQTLAEAMKESGKFKSIKNEDKKITVKNKEQAKKLGEDLYDINKYAKELRDAKNYNNGDYGFGLDKETTERYNLIIAKELGYKNYQEFRSDKKRYENISVTEINYKITSRQTELYGLKSKVIRKAEEEGLKPEGYHAFKTYDRYQNTYYSYAKYIKIGDNGFHYDNSDGDYAFSNLKKLGDIEGSISAKPINLDTLKEKEDYLNKYIK